MSELKNRKDIRTSLKKVFWSSKYHSKDLQVILDEKNATPYNPLGGGTVCTLSPPSCTPMQRSITLEIYTSHRAIIHRAEVCRKSVTFAIL